MCYSFQGYHLISFSTEVIPIAFRSLATKVVSENDVGKAQSLFGILEAIAAVVDVYVAYAFDAVINEFSESIYFYFSALVYANCLSVIM